MKARRMERIGLRCTRGEVRLLTQLAQQRGLSLSQFLREAALIATDQDNSRHPWRASVIQARLWHTEHPPCNTGSTNTSR